MGSQVSRHFLCRMTRLCLAGTSKIIRKKATAFFPFCQMKLVTVKLKNQTKMKLEKSERWIPTCWTNLSCWSESHDFECSRTLALSACIFFWEEGSFKSRPLETNSALLIDPDRILWWEEECDSCVIAGGWVPTWAEQSEAHTDNDNWCASIVNLEQWWSCQWQTTNLETFTNQMETHLTFTGAQNGLTRFGVHNLSSCFCLHLRLDTFAHLLLTIILMTPQTSFTCVESLTA